MIRVESDNVKEREGMRELVDGTKDRHQLEALRDLYVDRLHRRSNDFDATFGLRLVTDSLGRLSRASPIVTSSS
jgi:hypothetical protein